jgi:hypothetical protein
MRPALPERLAPVARTLADALEAVRERGAALASEVKRSDRFLRMRVAVVGTWALLSIATLWAACPSAGPGNRLGADVRVIGDTFVGGGQVLLRNASDEIWTDVVLVLDGTYRWRRSTMRPQDQVVVPFAQFRAEGAAPPGDFRPRSLLLECSEGRFRTTVEAK